MNKSTLAAVFRVVEAGRVVGTLCVDSTDPFSRKVVNCEATCLDFRLVPGTQSAVGLMLQAEALKDESVALVY